MKNENLFKFNAPEKEVKKITRDEIVDGLDEYQMNKSSKEEEIVEEEVVVPKELEGTNKFAEECGEMIDEIYEWYSKAMSRKEGRWVLEKERFINHFFNGGSLDDTYMFGDSNRGYLLGFSKRGVFMPTHFAPKSIRKGYDLIKELGSSKEIPVVMAITEDLVETIKDIPGWKSVDSSILVNFWNNQYEKQIVYNSHPNIEKLMPKLLEDCLEEEKRLKNQDTENDEDSDDYDNE